MEPDRFYREIPVWTQPDWWMVEYGALARWPQDPAVHPLFSITITGQGDELDARVNAAIDWLLDGPCGYAKSVVDETEASLRQRSHEDSD